MTSQKKPVAKTRKRVSDPNTSSLAVTPTDDLASPKTGRNEEGEVTVKTSADEQLASMASGIMQMNEMTWEKEESREGKVRDRRTPCLHPRDVGEALRGGSEEHSQDRRDLKDA